MSGILGSLGGLVGPIAGIAQSVMPAGALAYTSWIRAPRRLNTIVPDVTVEESHSDRLTVTQHPVAKGTPISDHAFKNPATITMRIGFTNANPVGAAMQGGLEGFTAGGGFGDLGGGLLGGAAGALGVNPAGIGNVLSGNFSDVGNVLTGGGFLGSVMEQRCKRVYEQLRKLQFDDKAWKDGRIACVPFTLVTGKRTYNNVVITELSVRTDHTTEYSLMVECHMQEVLIVEPKNTQQPSQANQLIPQKTASDTPHPPQHPTETPTPPNPFSQMHRLLVPPDTLKPGPGHPA